MSEDIYAKPDLTKKVRFEKSEDEDRKADASDNTNKSTNNDNATIYDNCWVEESNLPKLEDSTTEDQQQIVSPNVNSRRRNLIRAAAVLLVLLCLFLLASVIVLLIQNKSLYTNLSNERDKLQTLYYDMTTLSATFTTERDQLQTSYNKMQMLCTKLSNERDQLQANYNEIQILNINLTQKSNQLENETDLLMGINNNLTQERDTLKQQLDSSCCPDKWAKFGNSCLLVSNLTKNWNESKQSCENLCARLVIINSQDKQTFIGSLVKNAWIGLTNQAQSNVWKWVDGTVVNTTYWANGQPDNFNNAEHCVQITDYNASPLKNWNDANCILTKNFICEKIIK